MLKRIFPVVLTLLLISSVLVLSVSADGFGDGDVRYASIPFDSITIDGISYPYPANALSMGTDWAAFEFSDGLLRGHSSLNYRTDKGNYIGETTFVIPSYSFTLTFSGGLVFDPSYVNYANCVLTCLDFNDFGIENVSLTCSYYDVIGKEVDGTFSVGTTYNVVEASGPVVDTDVVSVGDLLSDALRSKSNTNRYAVFIDSLVVEVSLNRYTVNTPVLMITDTYSYIKPQFSAYIYSENISAIVNPPAAPSGEADLSDFVINTVEGFLTWEIFPGLSFSKILYIFVIIALLLWFITLLI